MTIWPDASSAQNSMAAVSAQGSTVCVLIRRLNSSCRRSIAFEVRIDFHWLRRKAREGEQLVARFLQAVGDGAAFEPPFADERLSSRFDLLLRRGIDHVFVVVRDFLVQPLGRMGEQIAVLVHRAALDRHVGPQRRQRLFEARRAVDDDEFRRLQSAPDEIVEQRPPGRLALAAHVLDRQQHFLAVRAHAERDEQRDRGRLLVEPHAHDRAVEYEPHDRLFGERAGVPGVPVALHLAPDPADHVLADRPGEHRLQRTAHAAGVGPGEISAGDQGVGGPGAALVGAKRSAPPFARLAVLALDRARGTAIRVLPNVPVSVRSRCPWRTPTTDAAASSSPGLRRP